MVYTKLDWMNLYLWNRKGKIFRKKKHLRNYWTKQTMNSNDDEEKRNKSWFSNLKWYITHNLNLSLFVHFCHIICKFSRMHACLSIDWLIDWLVKSILFYKFCLIINVELLIELIQWPVNFCRLNSYYILCTFVWFVLVRLCYVWTK